MEETNWTSIDMYYKGFHVKRSFPQNWKGSKIKKLIDKAVELGFEPSWNAETNKANDPIMKVTENYDTKTCPIHGVAMKKYTKEGRSWFSHMVSEGNWCNGKEN